MVKLKKQGMPVDSVEAAQAWRARSLNPSRTKAARARLVSETGGDAELAEAYRRRLVSTANLTELREQREREALISVRAIQQQLRADYARITAAATLMVRAVVPSLRELDDAGAVQTVLDVAIRDFLEQESRR
jgi:hypothetical protein